MKGKLCIHQKNLLNILPYFQTGKYNPIHLQEQNWEVSYITDGNVFQAMGLGEKKGCIEGTLPYKSVR